MNKIILLGQIKITEYTPKQTTMSKKPEKMVILDLTQEDYIATIPAYHDSPSAKIFEFWTEKGERINNLERIKHDTQKIVVKTEKGIQPLLISQHMQENLLEYFKFKHRQFKEFTCHKLSYYMIHGSIDKKVGYKIKKTENFEIGDTVLLGSFTKILGKTFTLNCEHSAICVAKIDEGPLFLSKLGNHEKVVVTTMEELKSIYWRTSSCAKNIWKN